MTRDWRARLRRVLGLLSGQTRLARARSRVKCARHDRARRPLHRRGTPPRRAGPARRRPGRAAHEGRCAGARLRLLLLLGAQDVRPDRHRRALRTRGAARGDATLAGRRRHDPGGELRDAPSTTRLPHKFEAGTPHIAGAVGLAAAVDYLETLGHRSHRSRRARAAHVRKRAPRGQFRGSRLVGTAAEKCCRRVLHARWRASARYRHDPRSPRVSRSAPVTIARCRSWSSSRVPATARASFSFYNTHDEVDRLARRAWSSPAEMFG